MRVIINDEVCWICGVNKDLTTHHALPQHLKPINNMLIPICKTCHDDKLNVEDIAGMVSFAYKIERQLNSMSIKVDVLQRNLETFTVLKAKK